MIKTDILQRAEDNIHGPRVKNYGPASESFGKVARIASILTGKALTPQDVLLTMTSAKLVRNCYSPDNDDHRVDACGYLGLLDEIEKTRLASAPEIPVQATTALKTLPYRMPSNLNELCVLLATVCEIEEEEALKAVRSIIGKLNVELFNRPIQMGGPRA